MKTSPDTHVALSADFPHYPEAEMQARATEFHAQMQSRRSIRAFYDRPVPQEIIKQCVLTAGTAPSGANHQPWYFACVGSAEKKAEIEIKKQTEIVRITLLGSIAAAAIAIIVKLILNALS